MTDVLVSVGIPRSLIITMSIQAVRTRWWRCRIFRMGIDYNLLLRLRYTHRKVFALQLFWVEERVVGILGMGRKKWDADTNA